MRYRFRSIFVAVIASVCSERVARKNILDENTFIYLALFILDVSQIVVACVRNEMARTMEFSELLAYKSHVELAKNIRTPLPSHSLVSVLETADRSFCRTCI